MVPAAVALDGSKTNTPETPLQKRDRLRREVQARGVDPSTIESITGDCEQQKAQQIQDLESWFAKS